MFAVRTALLSFGFAASVALSASAEVRAVTDVTFQREVTQSDRPVVVDFTASWCPPCRQMSPRIEQLAEEHPEVKVVQVDVDANPRLAERFQIESIPTFMVFYRGTRLAVVTGAMSYARLDRFMHDAVDAVLERLSATPARAPVSFAAPATRPARYQDRWMPAPVRDLLRERRSVLRPDRRSGCGSRSEFAPRR